MADQDSSAEQQLSDAIWGTVSRLVLAAGLIFAGFFIGYYRYGHATQLEEDLAKANDTIVDLKNQRETLSTQIARERRDKEVCRKDLKAARSAQ